MKFKLGTSSSATTAKKCTKKSVVHVQSCCFANLNLLLYAVVVAVAVVFALSPLLSAPARSRISASVRKFKFSTRHRSETSIIKFARIFGVADGNEKTKRKRPEMDEECGQ